MVLGLLAPLIFYPHYSYKVIIIGGEGYNISFGVRVEILDAESLGVRGHKIICAADFMKRPRSLLEAERVLWSRKTPVPEGWHEAYSHGEVDVQAYLKLNGLLSKQSVILPILLSKAQ